VLHNNILNVQGEGYYKNVLDWISTLLFLFINAGKRQIYAVVIRIIELLIIKLSRSSV
jgi:hypothetical protein